MDKIKAPAATIAVIKDNKLLLASTAALGAGIGILAQVALTRFLKK